MSTASSPRHQERPDWRMAVDLATRAYRLAEKLDAAGNARLADHLVRTLTSLPGALVGGSPGEADRLLLEAETLLLVAVRLGDLTENLVSAALGLIGELRAPQPAQRVAAATAPATPGEASQRPATANTAPAVAAPAARKEGKPATPAQPGPSIPPPESGKDRLIVDGCNFLGRAPGYSLGDEQSRDRLLFRLQEYAHFHPAHRVTVFFDGQRASTMVTAGVEQRVTSDRHQADDVIVEFLRLLARPDRSRATLVTDDRELAERAKREGVRVESVAWLVEKSNRKAGPFVPRAQGINRSEMDEWERFFSEPPKRPGKQR